MKDKFLVQFWDEQGRTAKLELCAFCRNLLDLSKVGDCVHYENDYDDNACSGFVKVEDVEKRFRDVFDCRCENGIN